MTAALTGPILPPLTVCERARKYRDKAFEGRFVFGVRTTGVYCRPGCPSRTAHSAQVLYFSCAAAAQDAGLRPCLRCEPERMPVVSEWVVGHAALARALRLLEAGYLNHHTEHELAAQVSLPIGELRQQFAQRLGTCPETVARLGRAWIARQLLRSTDLPMRAVALHAGYVTVRQCHAQLRAIFRCAPRELRGRKRGGSDALVFILPVPPPYDFDWVFGYLQQRALIGVEEVDGGPGQWRYRRLIDVGAGLATDEAAWVVVTQKDDALEVRLPFGETPLAQQLYRVRRVFDLHADGAQLQAFFLEDTQLGPIAKRAPGLRVPGTWNVFEACVRAILGQQVSVARGTLLANRMVEYYGTGGFPLPAQLMNVPIAELGMPGVRGEAISTLARQVFNGAVCLDDAQNYAGIAEQLLAIKGIGPWTVNYIRMRALKDPDAFPHNDWVVLKELACTAAEARQRAERWYPWRAYALMHLWYSAGLKKRGQ